MDAPYPTSLVSDWKKFLAADIEPSGFNLYPNVFHHDVLFPLQRMRETEKMMAIAREYSPRSVVEIGADKGGCVYHWLKCFPDLQRLGLCDEREVPYLDVFRNAFPSVTFVAGLSSRDPTTIRLLRKLAPFDVLFIDGEKSSMFTDFDIYLPYMNDRSVVFIHDVNDRPYGAKAMERVNQLYPQYKTEIHINTTESLEASERERMGIASTSSYEGWLRHWKGKSAGFGVVRIGG